MGISSTPKWGMLERWSPRLFLAAGGILVMYAAGNGLEAFTDMTLTQKGLESGYVLGFLGLLGLYPALREHSPWLSRIGAAAAVSGFVAFSAFTINRVAGMLGLTSGDPPGWALFVVLAATGFIVGYLAFGVAILRTGTASRFLGFVLLVPAIIIVLMFAHIALGLDSPVTVFVVSAGQAMAHIAIGSSLPASAEATDAPDSSDVAQADESPSDGETPVMSHD